MQLANHLGCVRKIVYPVDLVQLGAFRCLERATQYVVVGAWHKCLSSIRIDCNHFFAELDAGRVLAMTVSARLFETSYAARFAPLAAGKIIRCVCITREYQRSVVRPAILVRDWLAAPSSFLLRAIERLLLLGVKSQQMIASVAPST